VRRGIQGQLRAQGLGRQDLAQVEQELAGHLAMLETLLGARPFFTGEAASAADLALFGPMQALYSPLTPQTREAVARCPALVAWLGRVDQATRGPHTAAVE